MNTHKYDLIEIAEKFQSLKPKETNFDNTKTFKYFNKGDDSTLKDYLCSYHNTLRSKRSHYKSLSKNSLNVFNTTTCTTLQSTKKISFKVPSKNIDDDVEYEINLDNDKCINYDEDENGWYRFTEAIEMNFEDHDNTIFIYEQLLFICNDKNIFLSKYNDVFNMIEKLFDLTTFTCILNLDV